MKGWSQARMEHESSTITGYTEDRREAPNTSLETDGYAAAQADHVREQDPQGPH
jgi:hypothetical protein